MIANVTVILTWSFLTVPSVLPLAPDMSARKNENTADKRELQMHVVPLGE
jgi:hypothetical protein